MASGQRLLADLLGLTTTATDSLLSSKLQNITEEGDSVDAELQNDRAFHSQSDKSKVMTISGQIEPNPGLAEGENVECGRVDNDACDKGKCKEGGAHLPILKEKEKSPDLSERSQIDMSSSGSSERLPTPEPSDFIKSGVFVSSGQKSVGPMLVKHKDVKHFETEERNGDYQQQIIEEHIPQEQGLVQPQNQPKHQFEQQPQHQQQQQQHQLKQHLQQYRDSIFPLTKAGKSMGTSSLQQGKENVNTTDLDTVEQESEDVVVLRCHESQKKSIVQEKFKERMQSSVPVKKIAIPRFVKQSDSGCGRVAADFKEKDKQPASSSMHADEAASYAAVATSAAIAPFLQIQTALENQISSLVSTMNRAHAAGRQFSANSQKQEFKELESKVLELIDRKLQPSTVSDQLKKVDEKTYTERKVPVEPFGSASNHQMNRFGTTSDLQLIPTREYDESKRTSSPLNEPIPPPPSTHIPLASKLQMLHHSNIKAQNAQLPPPRSTPLPVVTYDKSTSPGSLFKRYLSNAKTQTSSSESSLVSEKSILETPLPRSKIPVPFARYTPKRENYHRHSKLIPKQYTRNGLTRKNMKEKSETDLSEKENMPPEQLEARRQPPAHTRTIYKLTANEKEEADRAASHKILKKEVNGEDQHVCDIAPIDRYLVYPLRGLQDNLPNARQKATVHEKSTVTGAWDGTRMDNGPMGSSEGDSRGHYITASKILSEIQQRRERLENNLGAILRHKDEQRLYQYLDQHKSLHNDDISRIRRGVDAKIQEISSQVKTEIQAASTGFEEKEQNVEAKKKEAKKLGGKDSLKGLKERSFNSSQPKTGRSKKVTEKKERNKRRNTTNLEPRPITRPPPVQKSPSRHTPALLASIIGEHLYKPHRSTVRPPHIQFHSPPKPQPKSEEGAKEVVWHEHEDIPRLDSSRKRDSQPPKYFFQPAGPIFPEPTGDLGYPARGELVPVAKSLGRPRQDERLRLPIPSDNIGTAPFSAPRESDQASQDTAKQPNVACFEVTSDLPEKKDKKKVINLGIQTLPSVDIQGESGKSKQEDGERKTPVKHITFDPPQPSDYEDFQPYIACFDVSDDDNNIEEESSAVALQLQGVEDKEPREYAEPRFPPQRPRCEVEAEGARIKYRTSLEQRTHEWLEQELLARIVAQMNIPQDPTILSQQGLFDGNDHSQNSDTDDEEEKEEDNEPDWMHEVLGAAGMQLFVDAGIPLNNDLIGELIKDAIVKKVQSLLGHPKHPRTPLKMDTRRQHRESFELPENVLTPLRTPEYTPIPSEASAVHTPLSASISTEESSSKGASFTFADDKAASNCEEDSKTADKFIKLPTPPQTPDVSENPFTGKDNVETPLSSMREEEIPAKDASLLPTPDASATAPSVRTLNDFASSRSDVSEILPEEMPAEPPLVLPRVQVARSTPSSHGYSFSTSSTTVGTSMFEGISEGERLCPDSVIPGLYSEGELPLSEGQAVYSIKEQDGDEMSYHKKLLKDVIASKNPLEDATDITSATLKDTDYLDEDTLEEVSISEGELLMQDTPLAKLLVQIRTPPSDDGVAGANRDKSEGEVSTGEEIIDDEKPGVFARERRITNDINVGFPKRILSMGEIADVDRKSTGDNSPPASLSVGETKVIPDNKNYLRMGKNNFTTSPSSTEKEPDRGFQSEELLRDAARLSLIGESLTEQEVADSKVDDQSGFQGPNAILVQSGNFGTASTFNFTDSLNEPQGNKTDEGKESDSMDQGTVSEERSEISDDIARDLLQRNLSGDRQPTKIMLMIPSVADEDSYDDITVEGGEASNDDVSNISL